MKKNTGFTLIELLVVIAIIGILSSVVLVSLNSARKKGTDARVQEEIAQVRTQLESDYTSGGYPDLTGATGHLDTIAASQPGTTNLTTVTNDIVTQTGGSAFPNVNSIVIYSTAVTGVPTDYAIYAKTSAGYNCIDNAGNTKANITAGAIAFPASGNLCQ